MESPPIKILMGIPVPGRAGGPPTHLPFLVEYFERHPGFSIRTFYYGRTSDKDENMLYKLVNTISTLLRFMIHLGTFRPDIVHINTAFDKMSLMRDVPFSLVCLLTRQRLLFKLHGSLSELIFTRNRFYGFMIRLLFSGAKKVGVLSQIEKEEFASRFTPSKMIVVKNIVSPLTGKTRPINFSRQPGKTYGIWISRLVKEKGIDDILNALPLILHHIPDFVLVVAGDGPYLEEAQTRARELGLTGHIDWVGKIENTSVEALLKSADIYIFTSYFPEGMPMSLIEAVKCGLPVITTRIRFAQDHFKDGVNCLFYDKTDHNALSEKIIRLVSDPVVRNRMIVSNKGFLSQFSQEVVGKEFESIYASMMDNKQRVQV